MAQPTPEALKALKRTLETAVDSFNLVTVLCTLSDICSDKENHLLEAWQEPTSARNWNSSMLDLDRLATKIGNRTGERDAG